MERLGLVEARCDTYAGLIFGCWDEDAPTLEAYLGDARWYLDTIFNRVDAGMQAYGPDKWSQPVNWKTPVDNSSDWYHATVTHVGTALAQARIQGAASAAFASLKSLLALPGRHVFVNGHSIVINLKEENAPRIAHGITDKNIRMFLDYYKSVEAEEVRRLGRFRALRLQVMTHTLFPNTVLFFRLALPRGPHRTEFWHFGTFEKDTPDEAMRVLVRGSQNNGTAGVFEQDDIDNWRQVTDSGSSPVRRKHRHQLSMGVGHAGSHPEYRGLVTEQFISESNQRSYFARWQEFMNAGSWADIRIEPIAADYEGTATMKG